MLTETTAAELSAPWLLFFLFSLTVTFKIRNSWINKSVIMHINVLSGNNSAPFSLVSYTIHNNFHCFYAN